MARLPDASQLETQAPRANVSLAADRSGEIIGNTVSQIGQQIQQKRDTFSLAQAEGALLRSDIEQREALENDNDWATYDKRYREGMSKGIDRASTMITDPSDRALFQQRAQQNLERGALAMRGKSKARETDEGRATVNDALEANRNAALKASDPGTRWALINSTQELLMGAQEKGYLSAQEREQQWSTWRSSYGEGLVSMQPPEERLKMLGDKDSPSKFIAPDRKAALVAAATKELQIGKLKEVSQSATDTLMREGLSETQAIARARQQFSGDQEDAVVSRIKERFGERDQARDAYRKNVADQAWLAFEEGGGKIDAVPNNVLSALDGQTLRALRKEAEATARGESVKTDFARYGELLQMSRTKPDEFRALDLRTEYDKLAPAERKELTKLQEDVSDPTKAPEVMELGSQLSNAHDMLKWGTKNQEQKGQFDRAVGAALDVEQRAVGRKLTYKEREAVIDRMMIQGEVPGTVFNSDKRFYEVTPEERASFVPDVPKGEEAKIRAALERAGQPATDAAVARLYARKLRLQ